MNRLTRIFEQEGVLSETSGNTPVLLSGNQDVWCILSGSMEVFAVQLENGKITGPKTHFFSAGPGDLLFGMDLAAYGMGQGFQAVGYPGTRVSRLDLCRLRDLGRSPEYGSAVAKGIDRWIRGISKGLTRDILPLPRPEILLAPGENVRADHDVITSPARGEIWVRHLEGQGLFIGTEDLLPSDDLIPLSPYTWILMLKGASVCTFSTSEAVAGGQVWPSMDKFHERLFQILFLNTGLKAADQYNLMAEKGEQQRRARQDGLARLASVMGGAESYKHTTAFDDPLVSACSLVGARLGISVSQPRQGGKQAQNKPLSVGDIALASGFNTRKVTLPENFWQKDLGPLLGFTREGNQPVALLPLSATAYRRVDPETGNTQRITAETAKMISPDAHTFYRPFPDKALTFGDLVRFGLKGCARELKQVLLMAVVIGLLGLIIPIVTGIIFSEVIPNAERTRIVGFAAILAGFALTTFLFEISRNLSLLRVESRLHHALESAVWDRLLRLSTPFFRRYETGDLTSRAMALTLIRQMVSGPVITTILSSLFASFNLGLLFYYDKKLALVALAVLVLGAAAIVGFALWQLKYIRRQTRIEGRIASRVLQFLSAVTKLRVSGAEESAFALWAGDFSKQKKLAFKAGAVQNAMATFMSNFLLFSLMVIFGWMILVQGGNTLKTGDFIAFNSAFAAMNAAMVQMILSLTGFIMAIPHYERLAPILETYPETDTQKIDPGQLSGKIEMNHISFRYAQDSPMVLKNVSLNIAAGAFVAIVGGSGSGKSTLIRLLLGFETPESGAIFYDDHDLADLEVRQVRNNMGVVVQGGNIMAGDIFTNIIGSHPLTLDDAWEAAAMAGLDRDIKDMPMGMHTVIMEGASTLSGGQRQRLMIARAIVNRPGILIFDEATSALDNRTQAIVSQSMSKLKATRIVVAHRLSTIKDADVIHVMDKGEIVESGTYAALMEKDGMFKKLARRQLL